MSTKKVELVVAPPGAHWVGNGFKVHGFIPGVPRLSQKRMDPFLILDYNSKMRLEPSQDARGVGVHPHKGFETVTIAYKGSVAHHDSTGSGGVIHEGDVQWMTAGSGVLHKEFMEEEFNHKGGDFQMLQLWVNLSSKDKKHAPKYQTILAKDIKKIPVEKGTVEVIAGAYQNFTGPATTFSPVNLMHARLEKGGKADFSFPSGYTTLVLVVEGEIQINGQQKVQTDHLALLKTRAKIFLLSPLMATRWHWS